MLIYINFLIDFMAKEWANPEIIVSRAKIPSMQRDKNMMTSWHGNALHITGPLWGESTGHQWIPLTKGQQCGSLIFHCHPVQAIEQTVELPMVSDASTLIWQWLYCNKMESFSCNLIIMGIFAGGLLLATSETTSSNNRVSLLHN